MPITKLKPENNYPYEQERLKALEQVVPEAFADGKINWDTLREVLDNNLEDENLPQEFFGLNWPGKREARKRAAIPSRATLVPAPGEGVNEDTTENLFIEGDNLEVLKLLQKSYAGKIKMIYIDPPYNTGNDFIYNDNFTDPLEAYLDYTGAMGESGELLTTNTRADGRFHSKWLNMIYPRLILARQMLREDGVIFVSIDDNEVHHLRQIMNEVFGEENFVACLVWEKKKKGSFLSNDITNIKEYVFTYCINKSKFNGLIGEINSDTETYPCINAVNGREVRTIPKGIVSKYIEPNYTIKAGTVISDTTMNIVFITDLIVENNLVVEEFQVEGNWRYSQDAMTEYALDQELYITRDRYIRRIVNDARHKTLKDILPRVGKDVNARNINVNDLFESGWGSNEDADEELRILLGTQKLLEYPKPTKLISKLICSTRSRNEMVLDFFSGSGTTAHAVMQLNVENNENLKYILVQLPELTEENSEAYKNGYVNVCDIGKERIRRAIKKIISEKKKKSSQTPLFPEGENTADLGFRVFKYSRSNFKQWKLLQEENAEALTPLFDNLSDPLISGWKKEDLLNEILLLEGFPLTSKVTYLEDHLKNEVYRVSAPDFCAHDLFVCLDDTIQPSTVELLTMEKEDIFVCLDSALSDELKARLQDQFNVHVI